MIDYSFYKLSEMPEGILPIFKKIEELYIKDPMHFEQTEKEENVLKQCLDDLSLTIEQKVNTICMYIWNQVILKKRIERSIQFLKNYLKTSAQTVESKKIIGEFFSLMLSKIPPFIKMHLEKG